MDVSYECLGYVRRWMALTCFLGHGGRFQHEHLPFLLVNTIAQQILVTLGPNLYHGCISGVSCLSSNMYDLFFEVMGVDFSMKILQFLFVNTINQQILVALAPN